MFTADIDTEASADDQDYVEQPLVAHAATRPARPRTRPRRRLRQVNNFNGKRKIAQCLMTTLVVLLVLGIVVALVHAIKTSEFNNESHMRRSSVNNRKAQRMPTNVTLQETRNILVAAQDLAQWQPRNNTPAQPVLRLLCRQQDCGTDFGIGAVSYQVIVFAPKNIPEAMLPLLLDTESLLIYANQDRPTSIDELNSLRQELDFDLTMSYRSDADINWSPFEVLWPNGSHFAPASNPSWHNYEHAVRDLRKQDKNELLKIVGNRTQFAVIHLCGNNSLDAELFEELKVYMPTGLIIDVDTKCENIDLHEDIHDVDYKFMLTFEDVLCTDKISAYFYKALSRRVIPVVLGGSTSYNNFAPPQSYIRAEDFHSVRELAERLVFLDEHPQAYLEYILASNDLKIAPAPTPICNVCRFLHEQTPLKSRGEYEVNENWWTRTECAHKTPLLSS